VDELSATTQSELAKFLPASAAAANPVDMVASAGPAEYRRSVEALLAAPEVESVIVIYTTIDSHRTEEILTAIQEGVRAGRRHGGKNKPVLLCTMAAAHPIQLNEAGETLPVYAFPEQAAKALGKVADYAAWRKSPEGMYPTYQDIDVRAARSFCQAIVEKRGDTWLTHAELQHLLGAFDLQGISGSIARTTEEAAAAARTAGFPVAIKMVSRDILHKTDVGGVRLDLRSEEAVRVAFTEITTQAAVSSPIEGVLVQPMLTGVETFMGLTQDPLFGPLVAFGSGGTTVEVFRDVIFRLAPLSDRDADEMLHGIRGVALLQGYRGRPAADLDALRDVLLRVSYLGDQIPELLELDFNPVIAFAPGKGCAIVDARARVGRKG
jgi:acetate---CoA ligase (ADP-forming)